MVDRQLYSAACDLDLHETRRKKKKDGRDAHLHSQKEPKEKCSVCHLIYRTENCVSTPKKKGWKKTLII
jgi:hypothetical protein